MKVIRGKKTLSAKQEPPANVVKAVQQLGGNPRKIQPVTATDHAEDKQVGWTIDLSVKVASGYALDGFITWSMKGKVDDGDLVLTNRDGEQITAFGADEISSVKSMLAKELKSIAVAENALAARRTLYKLLSKALS